MPAKKSTAPATSSLWSWLNPFKRQPQAQQPEPPPADALHPMTVELANQLAQLHRDRPSTVAKTLEDAGLPNLAQEYEAACRAVQADRFGALINATDEISPPEMKKTQQELDAIGARVMANMSASWQKVEAYKTLGEQFLQRHHQEQ